MRIVILFMLTTISFTNYAQSPWASGKGKGYGQLLFTTIPTYSTLFSGNGNTRDTERELSDQTLSGYIDYGLSDKITLSVNIPLAFVRSSELVDSTLSNPTTAAGQLSGLSNVTIAAKYSFYKRNGFASAFIIENHLPTRSFDDVTGLSTGVDAYTLFPKLSIGYSKKEWFLYGYFGYGIRNNNYNDVLNYGVEGGLKISENINFILNINAVNALTNGDPSVDSATNVATGFYTSFQEYNAFLIKVLVDELSGGLGAIFSVGGGSGNSVAVSPALSLGLFYKW